MMDEAVKTHKETSFGWVLTVQELATVAKTWLARRAQAQAARAAKTAEASRRYLAPR